MLVTFRAEKMLKRVKAEGLEHLLDDQMIALIWKLDGKEGNDFNWESMVKGNDLVWIPEDVDHEGTYVARCDCD